MEPGSLPKNPKSKDGETPPPVAKNAGEVCIIEADSGLGDLLVELLENQFLVKSFAGLKEFERAFFAKENSITPDLILCDSKLPDAHGLEALRRVRKHDTAVPFIFLVNQPEPDWTREAFSLGVTDLLEKPFESLLFINAFHGRIAQAKASRERDRLHEFLLNQVHLLTTHANRLIDKTNALAKTNLKKIHYMSTDEDTIRFQHASKREEKLLVELDQCRREYLELAEKLGKT